MVILVGNCKNIHSKTRRMWWFQAKSSMLVFFMICTVLQCICPIALSLLAINPRHLLLNRSMGSISRAAAFLSSHHVRIDTRLKLKNKHNNNNGDDFASYNGGYEEDNDNMGQELARKFYEEVEYRQSQPPSSSSISELEDNIIKDTTTNEEKYDGTPNTIRTVRIQANRNTDKSTSNSRRLFTNQPVTASSAASTSPLSDILSFFSISPPAPQSAGLFSGRGTTVYGRRSIQAEIQLLETTLKNQEEAEKRKKNGIIIRTPEQLEDVLRATLVSLILLSAAYMTVESGGGMEVLSVDHVAGLLNDVNEGLSSVMISVGDGEVFMGEEAAWLMKESSELAAAAVEVVKSIEASLVLL